MVPTLKFLSTLFIAMKDAFGVGVSAFPSAPYWIPNSAITANFGRTGHALEALGPVWSGPTLDRFHMALTHFS